MLGQAETKRTEYFLEINQFSFSIFVVKPRFLYADIKSLVPILFATFTMW